MRKQKAMGIVILAAAATLAGTVSFTANAAPARSLAMDCEVLGPVADNAVATLTPLQSKPADQAQALRNSYVSQLRGQEQKLTSHQGRADLDGYINAVQNATLPAAAGSILGAIGKIRSDCR